MCGGGYVDIFGIEVFMCIQLRLISAIGLTLNFCPHVHSERQTPVANDNNKLTLRWHIALRELLHALPHLGFTTILNN